MSIPAGSASAPRAASLVGSGSRTAALVFALMAVALAGMATGASFLIVAAVVYFVFVFPMNKAKEHAAARAGILHEPEAVPSEAALLVRTPDDTYEPRNRRVEITIR